ncbi:hypothetical protein KKD52_14780 [Myxococcota bacterium]|nr:hypothetical protein [Myxococcota bacterium]MBU1411811.1 hypothetical protein [Myxococcota bacterium]MBU1511616.1 hypothetical protein [Myxococcota bacterium]
MNTIVLKPYEFHPIANVFPLLEGADFEALKEDIRLHGQRDDIIIFESMILDGRNRYRACQELGLEVGWRVIPCFSYDKAVDFVISHNIHRRHLSIEDRAFAAAELANLRKGHNQYTGVVSAIAPTSETKTVKIVREERPPQDPVYLKIVTAPAVTQKQAAEKLQVPVQSVKDARVVLDNGIPELNTAVKAKTISLSAGREIAKLTDEDQKVAVKEKWTAQQAKDKRTEHKKVLRKDQEEQRYLDNIKMHLDGLLYALDEREEFRHITSMVNQIGHNVFDDWTDGPIWEDDDPEAAS